MVVTLSHFHGKLGPRVYMTYPLGEITKDMQALTKMMDIKSDEGFLLTDEEIKGRISRTLNYLFSVHSPVNRGKVEELLISYIITENDPEIEFYRQKILEAVKRLKSNINLYLAFHNEENRDQRDFILNELKVLDSELRKKEISTIGYIENEELFNKRGTIPIPMQEEWEKGKNYLLIYKREANGTFKITGYPTEAKKVYKIGIYNDEFKTEEYQSIMTCFKKIGAKIITSSGICQGKSVCLFEAYFEYDGDKDDIKKMQDGLVNKIHSKDPNYPMIISSDVTEGSFLSASSQK